jgi:allantoinase
MNPYPRDMIGYGEHPPHAAWPNGARVALQIVMNYEEGSEYSIPDGDGTSEMYLTEVPGATVGPASAI